MDAEPTPLVMAEPAPASADLLPNFTHRQIQRVIVGILLLAMGIMKAVMSWQYVPIWYHVIFTAILLPMAIVGGRLIKTI